MRKEKAKGTLNEGVTWDWDGEKTPKTTRVRTVRQVSPFQENPTNKIMRLEKYNIYIYLYKKGWCRFRDMLQMTAKKKEESFTQLCRFFMPLRTFNTCPSEAHVTVVVLNDQSDAAYRPFQVMHWKPIELLLTAH